LVGKFGPVQVSLTPAKQINVIQCHELFNFLSFIIWVIHEWETPDITETNLQRVIIFEVSYGVAKGEFMWKDATYGWVQVV